jgi:hypothetical protein
MTDWILDHTPLLLIGIVVACIAVCIFIFVAEANHKRECLEHGGRWEPTGTSTMYVMVGKTMVPQQITSYGCFGANQ